jgi:hypothetical protein
MRRYLLVLDMDLLAMDEQHGLEPISYLVAKQEREPCEVVVLSLVTNQPKAPPELGRGPLTWRARRDSNPQPSDP